MPTYLFLNCARTAFGCLLLWLWLSHPGLAWAQNRQVLSGHVVAATRHLTPVGSLPGGRQLSLVIGLPLRNPEELGRLLTELYDPGSPQYRRFLTPEEFARRFGPSEADYEAVIRYATAQGFQVTGRHPNRTLVDVSGSVADIEAAFHLTLRMYPHPEEARTFFAPDTEPSLDLAVPVRAISGLDNYRLPRPAGLKAWPAVELGFGPGTGSGPEGSYMGYDFRAAYVPGVPLLGTGQSVGLVEFDGYYAPDIALYAAQAGLPGVTLTNVLIDGFDGMPGPNDDEVSLDIEMAISMAPGLANVIIYQTGITNNPNDLLNRMATDNAAKQLSASWLYPTDTNTDPIFLQFAAQGQSFFNASGDADAYTGVIPTPAADTNITIVGGTTLTTSGPGGSWVSEAVWNWDYGVGSSGGISPDVSIPSWQKGINMGTNQGSTTHRNLPDVALTADNIWVVYDNGVGASLGGTSCATPLWAAFTALVNEQAAVNGKSPVGFLNPALYALGKGASYNFYFHDIIAGNNSNSFSSDRFSAVPGYDLCTGWGTPNGEALITALAPDALKIMPLNGFVSAGPAGGPFSGTNQHWLLTNTGSATLTWALASDADWLNGTPAQGTLIPGESSITTVTLGSSANDLVLGTYAALIYWTNQVDGVVQNRQFTLQVVDALQIIPSGGIVCTGYAGGPFSFTNRMLTLTNLGTATLDWVLSGGTNWLAATPESGALAVAGGSQVAANLNVPAAASLAAGNYTNTFSFTDLYDGVVQERTFALQLQPAPDWLEIMPQAGFVSTGFVHGPFAISNQLFLLTNAGPAPLSWALANTTAWLNASVATGTLASHGMAQAVAVSLTGSATNLGAGTYLGTIGWTNLNSGDVQTRQFTLVLEDSLEILPTNGFAAAGPGGGPFSVASLQFTLTNRGPDSLSWAMSSTSPWLTASPSNGVLLTHGPAQAAVVYLNQAATNLASGLYHATLGFTNLGLSTVQSRQFSIQVWSSLVQNGGFETGNFTNWTLTPTGSDSVVTNNSLDVHSGLYGAALLSTGLLSTLSQTLPTVPGQLYWLSLWLDNPQTSTPNEFMVAWDSITLLVETNLPASGWKSLPFLVTAMQTNTLLMFAWDNESNLGLDDVSVAAVPALDLQAELNDATNFVLTWNTLAGLAYQPQYKLNLEQTNWSAFGGDIVATGSTASVTDNTRLSVQRFYRVELLPQWAGGQ